MTEREVMREFWRLCDLVTEAERYEWVTPEGERVIGLIDVDEGQAMRDGYRDRADAVLEAIRKEERKGAPRGNGAKAVHGNA